MIVNVDQLGFAIGKRNLLNGISFSADAGELLVILGANGAGKSTLLKLISRELKAGSGSVLFNMVPVSEWTLKELSKCRAVLTQQTVVNLPFTAMEIIMMGRYPYFNIKPAKLDYEVTEDVMNYVGIAHLKDQNYLTLSGGEQQRVQLARVLSQIWDYNPQGHLLLLDEPVSALDMQYQHQILQLLRKLAGKGFTIVAVLHDLNLAIQYADKLLMLKNGKQVAHGSSSLLTESVIYEVFNIQTNIQRQGGYSFVSTGPGRHIGSKN